MKPKLETYEAEYYKGLWHLSYSEKGFDFTVMKVKAK